MDIIIDRETKEMNTSFGALALEKLGKYFSKYPFLENVSIFLRGSKHPTKKVKLSAHLKGKEVYAEASGKFHEDAFENAMQKLVVQLDKYKTTRYKKGAV